MHFQHNLYKIREHNFGHYSILEYPYRLASTWLSLACYDIRVIKQTVAQETLVMVYYEYFYSIMNYRIIFGVIHPTAPVFTSCKKKKKVVIHITGSKNTYSCHDLFIKLNILTLKAQYIFFYYCVSLSWTGINTVKL
jgi:hypothetical protein